MVYDFWCTRCPTRVHVEYDRGEVDLWFGRAYLNCPACGGHVSHPDVLMSRGIECPDGSFFKISDKTPTEHARLNAVVLVNDRQRDRAHWEREGKAKGFL
jgi:hypothetical protein